MAFVTLGCRPVRAYPGIQGIPGSERVNKRERKRDGGVVVVKSDEGGIGVPENHGQQLEKSYAFASRQRRRREPALIRVSVVGDGVGFEDSGCEGSCGFLFRSFENDAGGLAGDRRGVVPASGFSFSAQQIWKVIKENKDLDLPAHKVMVATVRCEEIANQKFKQLVHDEGWLALQEAVETGPVQGFGKRLSSILATYLSEYDMEAIYFDERVRNSKRQLLESKALDFVYPAYSAMLGHLRSKALEDFQVRLEQSLNKGEGFSSSVRTCAQSSMIEFEKGCADAAIKQANWDASKVREKLRCDIDARAASIRSAKLAELNSNYEEKTFLVFKWSCRSSTRNWCKRHLGFDTKTT